MLDLKRLGETEPFSDEADMELAFEGEHGWFWGTLPHASGCKTSFPGVNGAVWGDGSIFK